MEIFGSLVFEFIGAWLRWLVIATINSGDGKRKVKFSDVFHGKGYSTLWNLIVGAVFFVPIVFILIWIGLT